MVRSFNDEQSYETLEEQKLIEFEKGRTKINLTEKAWKYFNKLDTEKPELVLFLYLIFTWYYINFPKDLEKLKK